MTHSVFYWQQDDVEWRGSAELFFLFVQAVPLSLHILALVANHGQVTASYPDSTLGKCEDIIDHLSPPMIGIN